MPSDPRISGRCSVCHNRVRSQRGELMVREIRRGYGVRLWVLFQLCPPCHLAHLDWIRAATGVPVDDQGDEQLDVRLGFLPRAALVRSAG